MQDNDFFHHNAVSDELLRSRLTEIDNVLKQFDLRLDKKLRSIMQALIKLISTQALNARNNTFLEDLANPMLGGAFSNMLNGSDQPRGVSSLVGPGQTSSHMFRVSQGQLWAQAATAVARAMKRNL